MKKQLAFIIALFVVLVIACPQAMSATKVGTFGIPVSGTAPLEVDSDGALTVAGTLTVGVLAPSSIDATGNIDTDAGLYGAEMTLDSDYTVDPCGTLSVGTFFLNDSGTPCFCNSLSVDLSLYDGTTACF